MNQPIKLTPTERRAVLRAAESIEERDGPSCLRLDACGGFALTEKYGKFYGGDPGLHWFHQTPITRLVPTQNERVLMLLLFAEACK
jgi:hypothetical protein